MLKFLRMFVIIVVGGPGVNITKVRKPVYRKKLDRFINELQI